jgi:hypothetical protein
MTSHPPVSSSPKNAISRETPEELFRHLVQDAINLQGAHPSDMAEYYLVALLAGAVRRELRPIEGAREPLEETLAGAFLTAETRRGCAREGLLRSVGDYALFVSGFFAESLSRLTVGAGYYQGMGRMAYARLADEVAERSFNELFSELAEDFPRFVGILAEVSEHTATPATRSALGLYEKWLVTESATTGRRLAESGILPAVGLRNTIQ